MKKIIRKTLLFLSICLLLTTSVIALEYDGEVVENTCSLSFNFLGIVKKWTGHKLIKTTDQYGWTVINEVRCGEDGGSWDWFWE